MNKPKPKTIICIKLRTQMIQELSESFAIIMKKILSLKSANPPKQAEKHQTRSTTTHFEADKS